MEGAARDAALRCSGEQLGDAEGRVREGASDWWASGFGADAVAQPSLLPKGICQAKSITYGTVASAMTACAAKSLSFAVGGLVGLGLGGWAVRLVASASTIVKIPNAAFIARTKNEVKDHSQMWKAVSRYSG